MVQDSEGVSFDFDEALDEECSSEAFWSGTMAMTGADPDTLWFTDRPDRLAYTEGTAEFISGFGVNFSESTGGNPNAVLNWDEDNDDGVEEQVVPELRYHDDISPSHDAASQFSPTASVVFGSVPPFTPHPLPDPEQYRPPSTFPPRLSETPSLFIDGFKRGHGWAFNGTPRSSAEVKNRATIYPSHRGNIPCEIFGLPKSSCLGGCHI